jgi:hypothetical protein
MNRPVAEAFAAQVLGWLANDPGRIGAFLSATGLAPSDLRAAADAPDFLLAVIDFLMGDEALLLDCCAALGVPATTPASARAWLPGGEQVHWT